LFLATKIQAHPAPFSKEQMANPSPLGVLLKKLFTSTFLQAAVASPIPGIDFLRKFNKSLFLQKSAKYSLLVQQQPHPPIFCL
jgi:hypothetical protein